MNKEELIGKLQMVYVGDINALNELIGYYDGLKQGIEKLQQENRQLKEHIEKYEHYCKTTGIEELIKENKKYKEVIDKLKNSIDECWYMDSENVGEQVFLKKCELLDILKEVE